MFGGFGLALVKVVNDELAVMLHGALSWTPKMSDQGLPVVFQDTSLTGCLSVMKEKDCCLVFGPSFGCLVCLKLTVIPDQEVFQIGGSAICKHRFLIELWESGMTLT